MSITYNMKMIFTILMLQLFISCNNNNTIQPATIQNETGGTDEILLNKKFAYYSSGPMHWWNL